MGSKGYRPWRVVQEGPGGVSGQRPGARSRSGDRPPPQRNQGRIMPEAIASPRPSAALGLFERYLSLWVALCIVAGIALGSIAPAPFQVLGGLTIAQVNIPVAVLIWLMIVPMLLSRLRRAAARSARHWRGIIVTRGDQLAGQTVLAWRCSAGCSSRVLFRPFLPAEQIDSYIAGLILLAAAPCTAMVFVWSNLSDGDPNFTLSQVALNDTIMVVAFAPIVGLLLGLSSITVPWDTLFLSVVLYIVVPVVAAQLWRRALLRGGGEAGAGAAPARLAAGVAGRPCWPTLVLLFGFQGEQILAQPLVIAAARGADRDPGLFQCRPRLRGSTGLRRRRTTSPARRR